MGRRAWWGIAVALVTVAGCKKEPIPPKESARPSPPEDPPYDATPGGPGTEYRRDSHGPFPEGTCYYEHYKGRCTLEGVAETQTNDATKVVARFRTKGLDKHLEVTLTAKLADAKTALSIDQEVPCAFDAIYEGTCNPGSCAIELPATTPVAGCGMASK